MPTEARCAMSRNRAFRCAKMVTNNSDAAITINRPGNASSVPAPNGTASYSDPDLLVRFKRAAEDLGSNLGLFDLLPGGNGSGLVYLTDDAVGVIMPMRAGGMDADFCQWAAA